MAGKGAQHTWHGNSSSNISESEISIINVTSAARKRRSVRQQQRVASGAVGIMAWQRNRHQYRGGGASRAMAAKASTAK